MNWSKKRFLSLNNRTAGPRTLFRRSVKRTKKRLYDKCTCTSFRDFGPLSFNTIFFFGFWILITFFVVAVFQGVMVRLMLVLAPVACILSGISVSTVLTTYMKVRCSFYPPYWVPCGFPVQKKSLLRYRSNLPRVFGNCPPTPPLSQH